MNCATSENAAKKEIFKGDRRLMTPPESLCRSGDIASGAHFSQLSERSGGGQQNNNDAIGETAAFQGAGTSLGVEHNHGSESQR